jgi:hypothetical protein
MKWMAEITENQASELRSMQWTYGNYFGPRLINGKWYISEEEVIGCADPELRWVRRLPIIELEDGDGLSEEELERLTDTENDDNG